jgi:hypothetical protein
MNEALQKDAFGRCKTFRQMNATSGKKAGHNIEMRVKHEICRAFSTTEGARLWVTLLVEVATRDGRRQREWP